MNSLNLFLVKILYYCILKYNCEVAAINEDNECYSIDINRCNRYYKTILLLK